MLVPSPVAVVRHAAPYAALLTSAAAGTASGTGPLGAMSAAVLAQRFVSIPMGHRALEMCWSGVLPMSLALSLLGAPAASAARAADRAPMRRVGTAFGLGCAGSVLGALVAYRLSFGSMPLDRAAHCAGLIVSTYTGGSVNLFATARAIGLAVHPGGAALMAAIATADVGLMAAYFALIYFVARRSKPAATPQATGTAAVLQREIASAPAFPGKPPRRRAAAAAAAAGAAGAALALGGSAIAVGRAAQRRVPSLPGVDTAVLVGAGSALHWCLGKAEASPPLAAPAAAARGAAHRLADAAFNLFFAALGAACRPMQLLGEGGPVLAFSATALAVHVALAVGASLLLTRCSLDEALVASNAAIGGPGTAAAFAAAIGRPELVLSAAVWGTVGYAGGTTLGVAVWRVLRP